LTQPGYILVDLDHRGVEVVEAMRGEGLAPCVVLQTSPGHLQVDARLHHTPGTGGGQLDR